MQQFMTVFLEAELIASSSVTDKNYNELILESGTKIYIDPYWRIDELDGFILQASLTLDFQDSSIIYVNLAETNFFCILPQESFMNPLAC